MTVLIQGAKKGEQKQYTPTIADDSVASISKVKIIYGLSEGEVKGLANGAASIMLDGTPLIGSDGQPNFDGVSWEMRTGTVDQPHIAGMPNSSSETSINTLLRSGVPWVRSLANTELSSVNINVSWSRLSQTTDKGDVKGVTVAYAVDVDTDGYGFVTMLDTSITAKTSGRYQRTHNITLPPAQQGWQIRVRKMTADGDNERVFNNMQIDSIAEIIDAKLRYPHTAYLYISFDARAFATMPKLSVDMYGRYVKVPNNYNAELRQSSGIWNGQFKTAYTNNPAWVYYDIVTNDRYGLGDKLQSFMIDKWAVEHIARICDERVSDGRGGMEPRFTCNLYLQTAEDAYRVLQHISGIFRGMAFWDGAKIILDADTPRDADYVITRANVIDGQFVKTGTAAADRHTIAKVGYSNPDNAYETEYTMVRNERAIAQHGINILDLSAVGCTSESQAYRMGLSALLAEQHRTQTVSFSMGLDGSIPTVGSRVDIADPMFTGANNAGRISAVNDTRTVITIDRAGVPAAAGDTLIVNLDSGKAQSRTILGINGHDITVDRAFDAITPQNVWAVNTTELPTMPFIVMSITANDDGTQYDYTAFEYDPSIYPLIDNNVIVDTKPAPPVRNPNKINAPTSVVVSSRNRVEQGINVITLVIGWSQVQDAVAYAVEYRHDNGDWRSMSRTGSISLEINNVQPGTYTARVRAISAFNVSSKPTTSAPVTISAKPPMIGQKLTFNAHGILFGMFLSWQFGGDTGDTDYTEIQAATDPNIETSITTLGKYAYPTNTLTINGLGADFVQSYRARLVDKLGNKSDWTPWVEAVTSSDAGAVLELLSGKINQTQLERNLSAQIDLIDVNKVAISQETQERAQAIIDANRRIDGKTDQTDFIKYQQDTSNELSVQGERMDGMIADYKPRYTDATRYTDAGRSQQWTYWKTVARDNYALSQKAELIEAEVKDNDARYTNEINALATDAKATTTQVTQLAASTQSALDRGTANTGLIQTVAQINTDRYNSLAEQTTTIQTTAVDADDRSKTNSATVQQHATSINGLYGEYSVKIDVNGSIYGFGLMGRLGTSAFSVRADRFYIASPNSSEKTKGFIYQSTEYTDPDTGVVIPKGLYLENGFVKNASISTAKIRGQAVSVTASAYNTFSTTSKNVYLRPDGSSVQVRVVVFGLKGGDGTRVTLYKNGVEILSHVKYGGGVDSFSETVEFVTSGGYGTDKFHATTNATSASAMTITAVCLKR